MSTLSHYFWSNNIYTSIILFVYSSSQPPLHLLFITYLNQTFILMTWSIPRVITIILFLRISYRIYMICLRLWNQYGDGIGDIWMNFGVCIGRIGRILRVFVVKSRSFQLMWWIGVDCFVLIRRCSLFEFFDESQGFYRVVFCFGVVEVDVLKQL